MSSTLRERALRLLARREHTRAELQRKLAPHAESGEEVAALLADLAERQLLSDQRYAENRTASRAQRLGNSRLKQELRTQGVADAIISAVIDAAGDETARAREVWQKKFGQPPGSREEWAKQARFLQGRGFGSDAIRRVLKDCDVELSDPEP